MNVLFFLKERTHFIRQFYETASSPFVERKRQIQAGETPFVPPYSEDAEPAFLTEWTEAGESLDVLGQVCISLVATSLELFLRQTVWQLTGQPPQFGTSARKHGWLWAYRALFRDGLGIDWEDSGANLDLLEEIVLARNSGQHAGDITNMRVRQTKVDFALYPRGFFIDDFDRTILDGGNENILLFPPSLEITGVKLFAAVDEVELFCAWTTQQRPSKLPHQPLRRHK